jgi:hypothetical protein
MYLCKGFIGEYIVNDYKEQYDWEKEPNCTQENWNNKHYCVIPCKCHLHGQAIDECYEDQDGCLFASNGEYGSQVNFCPMCGYEAKVKIKV